MPASKKTMGLAAAPKERGRPLPPFIVGYTRDSEGVDVYLAAKPNPVCKRVSLDEFNDMLRGDES